MISLSQYRSMKSVPAGAILNSIIAQQQQTKASVARKACLLPQRINDLIMGVRRFTVDTSLKIEKALDIQESGFFYLHQAEHDVYLSELALQRKNRPDISLLSKTTFWDVDIQQLNWKSSQKWAIRRVLEYGELTEVAEIFRFYGRNAFEDVLQHSENFRFPDKVQKNWTILNESFQ